MTSFSTTTASTGTSLITSTITCVVTTASTGTSLMISLVTIVSTGTSLITTLVITVSTGTSLITSLTSVTTTVFSTTDVSCPRFPATKTAEAATATAPPVTMTGSQFCLAAARILRRIRVTGFGGG